MTFVLATQLGAFPVIVRLHRIVVYSTTKDAGHGEQGVGAPAEDEHPHKHQHLHKSYCYCNKTISREKRTVREWE